MALSGETALVGAAYADSPGVFERGAAYVFVRLGTLWSQQQKLSANDGAASDLFGSAVALSGDTALVGAYGDTINGNSYQGSAYVFTRSGTTWSQQQKLTASDGTLEHFFGNAVALSGDVAVIGAYGYDPASPNQGAAYVFVRNGASWTEQKALHALDKDYQNHFGQSVAVSGNLVLAGAPFDTVGANANQGSVYSFEVVNTPLAQIQKLSDAAGPAVAYFGDSLALHNNTAVVGAYGDTIGGVAKGSAYVFVRNGATWSLQQKLTAADGASDDRFGRSVAINGETVVVGAYFKTNGAAGQQGAAYVFVRNGAVWTQQQKLLAADGAAADWFGYSVALYENTALIGAAGDTVGANGGQGSAYTFKRSGATWSQQQKLTANDGTLGDYFGTAVALFGNTAVIGAPLKLGSRGAAYVFTNPTGTQWNQAQKLTAADGAANHRFGTAVALDNYTALIGAVGNGGGAAYVYAGQTGTWTLQQELFAGDAAAGEGFGSSVTLFGDYAVVGASFADIAGDQDQGAAYLFERQGTTWSQRQKLTAADGAASDYLGTAVAIAGTEILAGAPNDNIAQTHQGSVYYFRHTACPTISLTPANLPSGDYNVSYTQQLTASGGVGPYVFELSSGFLPRGLTLADNGLLLGTPTQAGAFNFTVTARQGNLCGGSRNYTLTINYFCFGLTINPSNIPAATINQAYNQMLSVSNGNPPYVFTLTPNSTLPNGVTLNQLTGLISGTPTVAGVFQFQVGVVDFNGCQGLRAYTLNVNCPAITVNPATLPGGTVGIGGYNQPLSASGGVAPYSFSLNPGDSLPPGLSLVNGAIVGGPQQGGTFNFTIKATDAQGCVGLRQYSFTATCQTINVFPASLPAMTVGVPFNQGLSAAGSDGPYTFALDSGALPNGLTLTNAGLLSGTPTTSGNGNFTIKVSDVYGCFTTKQYSFSVGCPTLTINPASLPNGATGTAYNQQLTTTGGVAPYSYSLPLGTLPPAGLSLSPSGALSGTPTQAGTFNLTVNVSSGGCTGQKSYTLTITQSCNTITITPASLPNGALGVPYSQQLTQNGGTGNVTYNITVGNLPAGLNLSPSGLISGTPSQNGGSSFTVTATDANGCTGQKSYAPTITCPAITVGPATLPNGNTGTAYNQQLTQSGGVGNTTFGVTVGSLPAGLNLSTSGLLSGSPTQAGAINFTVTAADANTCIGTKQYTLTITQNCGALTVNPPSLPNGTAGTAYNQQLSTTGGTAPYSYGVTAGALPNGVTLTTAGLLSGTPTQAGVANFTVTATDANGCARQQSYTLTINAGCPTITITPATLPTVFLNVPYSQQLTASGGAAPYSFSIVSSSVPAPGLTITTAGLLTGTIPAGAGGFGLSVKALDANGCSQTLGYNVTIQGCPIITVSPTSLPAGTTGTAYNQNMTASGGLAPYTYNVSAGALPAGLTLSSAGALTGTPTTSGQVFFTIQATDAGGCKGTRQYALTINGNCPTITVNPATLPAGQMGAAYNQTITATGGAAPYAYTVSLGTLPNGVTLSSAGVLSGTPTVSGQFGFTLKATDANGCMGTRDYTLTTNGCPTITVNPATLPNGTLGAAYNQTLTASGGAQPYVFSLQSGAWPAGVSLSGTGTVTGTPTANGAFNVTVKATDANGCIGTRAYTLNVSATCPTITVNPATLPGGFAGAAYNQVLTASGGGAPYTFSVDAGVLPNGLTLTNAGVLGGTPTQAGSFGFTIKATDAQGCMGTRAYTLNFNGAGLMFYPLPFPLRLLDTRAGMQGCDTPGAPIAGGTARTQLARRTCNNVTIPANALAVTGNVTTVQSGGGYLTLYPSNAGQPLVANTNFAPNEILNNVFTVGLGNDGAFKIFATSNTDVVVDVTGYYAPPTAQGLYFHALPQPLRLLETRAGMTGCFTPGAPLAGNADTLQMGVTTCGGVTIPATARALVGNATTVGPQGAGYLTLFPADAARPLAASSNFTAGQVMNAPFTVGLSVAGAFKIYTTAQTELVIDVSGYYSSEASDVNGAGLLFTPLPQPIRLLETRAGLTGCYTPNAPLGAGATRNQQARGTCSGVTIANDARGLVGNATVVGPLAAGYLTFWPNGAAQPLVAASNYNAGAVFNRHFTVGLGVDGVFNIFTAAQTELVLDVSGYYAP